jgi:putative solute:sodium symporter small subunit
MARHAADRESGEGPGGRHATPPEVPLTTRSSVPIDHWGRTRRLTGILLAIWFCVTFCVIFFARELSHLSVFGWQVSYYMAAQGATLIYVIVVGVYAWRMQRLDQAWAREVASGRPRSDDDAN